MIYLDNGATSFHKPPCVHRAVLDTLQRCANPGRGGYRAAAEAAKTVFRCRSRAADFFDCQPEQVVFTSNCTHGLNIAIADLVQPGSKVVISGFEHNAVVRPLHLWGAQVTVAGRRLFDPEDTLTQFRQALQAGADVAIFTHVSNVFGYILPVAELAALCREYHVPFIVDAAQSAGVLEVPFSRWGADYVAMPGHKGLLGPQGTGLLLCKGNPAPLMAGGTGSESKSVQMPDFLPDRLEAGTLNVPGIAGLEAGMAHLCRVGLDTVFHTEHSAALRCAQLLQERGYRVFSGQQQTGTVSFVPEGDCEEYAQRLSDKGIAVRSGLHCAPLAHESAGTLDSGTVRISFGQDITAQQLRILDKML